MDIISYILSRKYVDNSIVGLGSIRGANCTVKDIVHQDGINTVTFEWTGTDGTTKTRDMVVYDGTPIYVWESGNTYHYGDLAIYESQFYRCIVENNDATFDSTKWNEIGSPDGNYDIVQSVNLLPARFTTADRKLYYVIDENCFYLWNGTAWVKTISNKIADLDDVNLDDLTEGDVLVWDSVNEKWVNKAKFDEYKTAFTGTEEEWNALTSEEQNVYDIINITNDGDVLNLGIYLEKTTAMPVASEDVENKIYLYTGTTTQDFKKGVVYQCVSDGEVVPTYSWVALIDFGTAAIKNSTDRVSPNNTALVESQSVYSAINTALSSIYTPRGDITCAELTSSLLISDNIGNVYEVSDSGTTSALFLQGAGRPIAVGSNVGIINAGESRILFNLMANAFDLTSYQKKDLTSAIEGQTTVEGALGALSTNKQDSLTFDNVPTENSNNPVKSGGVYAVNETLTNRVKGNWSEGGKNKLPNNIYGTTTNNGVTVSRNDDGSLNISGTNTYSNVISISLSDAVWGSNSGGEPWLIDDYLDRTQTYTMSISEPDVNVRMRMTFYDSSKQVISGAIIETRTNRSMTIPNEAVYAIVRLAISQGATVQANTVVYPMIRLASITDDTYEPYSKTNQQLTQDTTALLDNLEVNGAVNMLPNNFTTQTINGVTFTVNDDGSITANGTATALCSLNISGDVALNGTYKMSGCPGGGSSETYFLRLYDSSSTNLGDDVSNGKTIYVNNKTCHVNIIIRSGTTVSAITFKPMITVPTYNGDYVPYAKSNRELTEDVTIKDVTITPSENIFDVTHLLNIVCAKRMGKIVIISGNMPIQNALTNDTVIFSVSEPPIARVNILLGYANAEYKACAMYIDTHGNVKAYGAIPANANYCFSFMYLTE